MYIPPVVILALMQVGGPDCGDRIKTLPPPVSARIAKVDPVVPAQIASELRKESAKSVADPADEIPVIAEKKVEKPETGESTAELPGPIVDSARKERLSKPQYPESPPPRKPGEGVRNSMDQIERFRKNPSQYRVSSTANPVSRTPRGEGSGEMDAYLLEDHRMDITPKSRAISENEELISRSLVELEKYGNVFMSVGIQGELVYLQLPLRDFRTGRDILDPEGNPIMVPVRPGQLVRKGEVIGIVKDDNERNRVAASKAQLDVAIAEQEKKIEIEYAEAALYVAAAEYFRNVRANEEVPNTIPDQIVLESNLRRVQAKKQLEKSLYDLNVQRPAETEVKRKELAIAETMLEDRKMLSPIDGIVVEVVGAEGEYFREGDKILRIVQLDKLRVGGRIDSTRLRQKHVFNKRVTVSTSQGETLQGKVVFANPEMDLDDTFKIHVEVLNRKDEDGSWLLSPNEYVEMVIHLNQDAPLSL